MDTPKRKITPKAKPALQTASHEMWRYGPGGERVLLKEGDLIPEGFADTPAKFERSDDDNS